MSHLMPYEAAMAAALRAERIRQHRKLAEIAALVGVVPQTVSQWELGDRRPAPAAWIAWIVALGFERVSFDLQRIA